MQPAAKGGIPITDFAGLVTNTGAIATDAVAQAAFRQVNICCTSTGEITSRPGLRPCVFDEDLEDE